MHTMRTRAQLVKLFTLGVRLKLSSLCESCNNHIADAVDAYARASELDSAKQIIAQHFRLLKNAQNNSRRVGAAP